MVVWGTPLMTGGWNHRGCRYSPRASACRIWGDLRPFELARESSCFGPVAGVYSAGFGYVSDATVFNCYYPIPRPVYQTITPCQRSTWKGRLASGSRESAFSRSTVRSSSFIAAKRMTAEEPIIAALSRE